MSNTIKGGALEFDIIANNGMLDRTLEETKRRVQGFTNATVAGGEKMELAFREAAIGIDKAFADIDNMADMHRSAIAKLEKEYAELGEVAAAAFMKGTAKGDEEYRAIRARQEAVKKEIETRKGLMREIEATADALQKEEQRLNATKEATEKNTKAQISLRTEIKLRREEMAALVLEAQREGKTLDENSGRYAELRKEIGNLTDLQGDIAQQAKALGNDEGMFQGVVSAISGVSGAFTAAQGAIGLFAGENENLQKIMLKVQSLMSITIGLQQVAQTLNKDSYFSLKILGGIKEWWAGVVAKATVTEAANTTATVANTAAKEAQIGATTAAAGAEAANTVATGAQTAAATAGTAANIGLAGAFRMVGVAIKSIPVFGWIITGITALGALVWGFTKKAREARKAAEEFHKEVAEIAAKPIAAIQELSFAWTALGDDMEAKQKFVEDNADRFKDLGVSIKNVADAEKLLVKHKDAFIKSEMAKAKAMAARAQAADLIEDSVKNQQKLDEARKKPTVMQTVLGAPMAAQEIANPDIKKYEEKGKELDAKIKKIYDEAANYEAEGLKHLKEVAINETEKYDDGTVGAIEKAIADKQDHLKTLSDPIVYKAALKEIEALQKQVDAITGNSDKKDKTDKEYTEGTIGALEKAVSAKQALLKTLSDPEAYRAALKEIEDLQAKIDAITGEAEKAVLDKFEKELKTQLTDAHSILEMLSVLDEQRKQLTGDGSELDNGKKKVLDTAQADVAKKAQEDLTKAKKDYDDYLQSKIDAELSYLNRRKDLEIKIAKETDAERRKILQTQLQALDTSHQLKQDVDYDRLVEQYRSYQQRRADIAKEYDEKIALATEKGNAELVQQLTEARDKSISSVALEELQSSGAWEQLFGKLDDLTIKQINNLIAEIEDKKAVLGVKLSPIDLKTVMDNLEKAKEKVRTSNPFIALRDGLKAYKEEANKTNLTKVFDGVSDSLSLVKGSFDAVVGGLDKMGLAGDEVTQKLLGDISEMVGSAGELAAGIATGNPLQIIQGSIGFITSAFEVFNSRDRRAERAIKKHAEAVKELEKAYTALSWAVDKALGETVYDNQRALIDNMRKQREHLLEMQRLEESKKKTDRNKIDEYKQQYEELGRQIEDTIADIAASITQTTAKDLANELADAIVEAFGKGETAAKAFESTAQKVMQNAVKNALKLQFLEKPLQNAINQLQRDMGFDSNGNGSFDGLTEAEQKRFKDAVVRIGGNFADAMKMYQDLFEDLEAGGPTTTLSGAIKGASQESIDLLAGQTNAVRVNQVQSIEILRDQLLHLASIDAGIGITNRYLQQIEQNTKTSNYDPLRAQGITN